MKNIYLTKRSKKKYMSDFLNNVLKYKGMESWRLDPGLDDILGSVNRNPHIQSLYSRKDSFSEHGYLHESFLEFCYSRTVELKLLREVIPSFSYDFIREFKSNFYYQFSYPRMNPNFVHGASIFGMGCIDDPDYFRINTIRLTLESPIRSIHQRFWTRLEASLSGIEP